jgi:HK97 gp10 family phage protein
MEELAKEYVPTISGNLQSGIKSSKVAPYTYDVSASSLEGGVPEKNTKEYAGYVEFGTSKMAPRYFMTRAWRDTYPLAAAELRILAAKIERL